jgi:methionyl-tRNA synthetase
VTTFLTTTIPYVNAAPHIGFALEAVQADVLARHRRLRGEPVRLLSGTDDNSLKNVLAAEAAKMEITDFVDANAARFAALAGPLSSRTTTSSVPAATPVTASASKRCGAPAPRPATFTRTRTRVSIASAARTT